MLYTLISRYIIYNVDEIVLNWTSELLKWVDVLYKITYSEVFKIPQKDFFECLKYFEFWWNFVHKNTKEKFTYIFWYHYIWTANLSEYIRMHCFTSISMFTLKLFLFSNISHNRKYIIPLFHGNIVEKQVKYFWLLAYLKYMYVNVHGEL